jgi:aminopeptidase Y
LVAHSVATFAVSFKGFPERTDAATAGAYEKGVKYHGHKLVI